MKKSPTAKKRASVGGQGGISGVLSTLVASITTIAGNLGKGSQASNGLTFQEQKELLMMQKGPDVHVAIVNFTTNYCQNLTVDEKITFKLHLSENPQKCSLFEEFDSDEKMGYIKRVLAST